MITHEYEYEIDIAIDIESDIDIDIESDIMLKYMATGHKKKNPRDDSSFSFFIFPNRLGPQRLKMRMMVHPKRLGDHWEAKT